MTLTELLEQYKGQFSAGHVSQLEAMENALLHFDAFTAQDALELGTEIVRQSRQYGEDIAVRILRCKDDLPIFQYVGDTRAARNLNFAMAKAGTVKKTGHCSLWALAQQEAAGGLTALFEESSGCLPVGGAFPIFVGGELAAIAATSGLHHGHDHEAVAKALCAVQAKPLPPYDGPLI